MHVIKKQQQQQQHNTILLIQRNEYKPKWSLNWILMSGFWHKKEYPALDPKLYTWPEVSLNIREDSQPKSSRNMISFRRFFL